MKDLSNSISPAVSLAAAVRTAAANGTGVDLQGYESATVLVDVGAEGDTLSSSVFFEVSLEESDDNSTFTDVEQAGIVDGTIASGGIFLKLDGTTGGDPDEFIDNLDVDNMSAPVFNSGESGFDYSMYHTSINIDKKSEQL